MRYYLIRLYPPVSCARSAAREHGLGVTVKMAASDAILDVLSLHFMHVICFHICRRDVILLERIRKSAHLVLFD